jgi:hypothetical protein
MSLASELQAICDEHGQLTPSLVVDAARPEDHPLHGRFEWDDQIAGEAHRRDQAKALIRRVRVVYRQADDRQPARSVRQYHAVMREGEPVAYEPAEAVAADPAARELLLRQMQRDWQALRRRWGAFTEFAELVKRDLGGDQAA